MVSSETVFHTHTHKAVRQKTFCTEDVQNLTSSPSFWLQTSVYINIWYPSGTSNSIYSQMTHFHLEAFHFPNPKPTAFFIPYFINRKASQVNKWGLTTHTEFVSKLTPLLRLLKISRMCYLLSIHPCIHPKNEFFFYLFSFLLVWSRNPIAILCISFFFNFFFICGGFCHTLK